MIYEWRSLGCLEISSFLSMLSDGLDGMRMEISGYSAPLHGPCLPQRYWEARGSNCCCITQSLCSLGTISLLPLEFHYLTVVLFDVKQFQSSHLGPYFLHLSFSFLENVLNIFSLPFRFLMP